MSALCEHGVVTVPECEICSDAFWGTELEGVLPSIQFIKDHLAQFDDQFALAIKHLDNAAKATLKIGTSS